MTKLKRILSLGLAALSGVALASCSPETETVARNTTVPYGSLSKDTMILTANSINSLNQVSYYDRLRNKSYDTFVSLIKKEIYKDQITAISNLLYSNSFSDLTSADKIALSYTDTEITEDDYNYLLKKYSEKLSNTLSSSIFGVTSAKQYINILANEKDIAEAKATYIEGLALQGYTVTADQIVVSSYDLKTDKITIDYKKLPADVLEPVIQGLGEIAYSEKKLYAIADKEYITEVVDNEEKETKNNYYYFNDAAYKSSYNSEFYNAGTYKAIIIQFNSRREALENIDDVLTTIGDTSIDDTNVDEFYTALYNRYYNYRGVSASGVDDPEFTYVVNSDVDDFSDVTPSIKTFITETLENGQYLTEARNIDQKYVMAYHVSTEYDVHEDGDASKQLSYDELKLDAYQDEYNELLPKIKRNIIESNVGAYQLTALNNAIDELCDEDNPANSKLKIYDPYLEYKFNYSYTNYYELITPEIYAADNANNNLVFAINDTKYTVADYYNLCSMKYGSSILTDYILYEYVLQYADDLINEDIRNTYNDTLNDLLTTFNNNENSTYPKEIGEETYMLAAFGYSNKDDVLKYYYKATAALTNYKNKKVFTEWATSDSKVDTTKTNAISYILDKGNAEYNNLFSITLQHVLIYIDDDGDGNPDDPKSFLELLPAEKKTEFENAVTNLAKAIYSEATYVDYSDNTLVDNLNFIVKQYNKGAQLRSDSTKTWDYYKTFNFMIKVEDLGTVDQSSVDNYVQSFGDYVKDLYKLCSEKNLTLDDDNGTFIATAAGEFAGGIIENANDLTFNSICATEYGYHVLIGLDYKKPNTLKFTEDDDENAKNIAIILESADEDDEDSKDISIIIDAYNEDSNKASFNQLFIYYTQSKLGVDSTLNQSISSILSSLFSKPISVYESSTFQNLIIFDKVDATSTDTAIQNTISLIRANLVNQITEYDSESKYADWCAKNSEDYNWTRPDGM